MSLFNVIKYGPTLTRPYLDLVLLPEDLILEFWIALYTDPQLGVYNTHTARCRHIATYISDVRRSEQVWLKTLEKYDEQSIQCH